MENKKIVNFGTDEEILENIDISDAFNNIKSLVVYNDNINSFDYVINCFIIVLKFSEIQSEQLAYQIHNKGKAIVKTSDNKEKLTTYLTHLTNAGLKASIN